METDMQMQALTAFNSLIKDGLQIIPQSDSIHYSAGNTLILQNSKTRAQSFLKGHQFEISTLTVSKCGKYAASAEKRDPGFLSEIIVWDLGAMSQIFSFKMHKGSVKKLAFSAAGTYLGSVGCIEDKNRLIVWDLKSGKAAYCLSLGLSEIRDLVFFNCSEESLVAASETGLQVLTLNSKDKKIDSLSCNIGNLKRSFSSILISPDDQFFYAGTKTGDVIEMLIERGIMKKIGPCGQLFEHGVKALLSAQDACKEPCVLVGSGDGKITLMSLSTMKRMAGCDLEGSVSSICRTTNPNVFLCGTEAGNIYQVENSKSGLSYVLKESAHVGRVNAVCFPKDFSEVFATCGREQIRVWALKRRQELLRICVSKTECFCLTFSDDGKAIVSGWSDGKLRAFYPQSGKLMWAVEDAHAHGATSLALTADFSRMISGGMEGEIRIWRVTKNTRVLEHSLKEHRGRVWSMKLREEAEELVSCSADGSCVIWDLKAGARIICIFDKTIFKDVVFYPDGSQLVTVGSDAKITYWSSFEGEAIRVIQESEEKGEVNAVDVSKKGSFMVTGGQDGCLSVWSYQEGKCVARKIGNCGGILGAKISPDEGFVVTTGVEGDVAVWELSEEIRRLK